MDPREKVLCIDRVVSYAKLQGSSTVAFDTKGDKVIVSSSKMKPYKFNFMDTLSNNGVHVQTRGIAEDNHHYKQLVICLLAMNKSHTKAIVLRRNDSGLATLMQGHTTVPDGINDYDYLDNTRLYDALVWNLEKEAGEEIRGMDRVIRKYPPKLKFFSRNDQDRGTLAYYHIGFIFTVEIDDSTFDDIVDSVKSGEPEKHQVVTINLEDWETEKPDIWLKELLELAV